MPIQTQITALIHHVRMADRVWISRMTTSVFVPLDGLGPTVQQVRIQVVTLMD